MMLYRSVQEKVHEELDRVIGNDRLLELERYRKISIIYKLQYVKLSGMLPRLR